MLRHMAELLVEGLKSQERETEEMTVIALNMFYSSGCARSYRQIHHRTQVRGCNELQSVVI